MTRALDQKTQMRRQIRGLRKSLKNTLQHAILSRQTSGHLLTLVAQHPGKMIASYSAIGSELDLRAFHEEAPNPLCLPVINPQSRVLSFAPFRAEDELSVGQNGTVQPQSNTRAVPDIVLVPLIAYDARGNRLGQGGGYYDATLAALKKNNPKTLAIGAAFSLQKVETIPCEPHDAALDAIATERGIDYV